jgi:tRNA (cytidine/uridine-2'-O-)-methyltransferase
VSRPTLSEKPEAHTPVDSAWGHSLYANSLISKNTPQLIRDDEGYVTPECAEELFRFHPEVVLYCPEIPQNTGSISRLCAAMSSPLHLIEPMAFTITEKKLRRAGLDYWPHVRLAVHANWESFLGTRPDRRFVFVETGGTASPESFNFLPGDVLVFGGETGGIPRAIIEQTSTKTEAHLVTIPMFNRGVRSLNLANTVSIVLYMSVARLHQHG